jgi:hypothetical protein
VGDNRGSEAEWVRADDTSRPRWRQLLRADGAMKAAATVGSGEMLWTTYRIWTGQRLVA